MQVKYEIVSTKGALYFDSVEALNKAGFETSEREAPSYVRKELQDAPKIEGFCGPMWGGWRDAANEYIFF